MTELAQCKGKKPIKNARTAWRAARRHKGRVAYFCNHCGAFHVGHKIIGKPAKKQVLQAERDRVSRVQLINACIEDGYDDGVYV